MPQLYSTLLCGNLLPCHTKKVWNHFNTAPFVAVLLKEILQPLLPTKVLIVSFPSGFTDDMIEISTVMEFDPAHQITLHICPDIVGLLGDENGDSGMIRSDISDVIKATSNTAPFTIINYLEPPSTPPLENQSPPIVPTNYTTSKEDALDSSFTPSTTPSVKDALNNRSEQSSED